MERHHLLPLPLLLLALAALVSSAAAVPSPADVEFVRSSCTSTRYPALCVHCLSGYAAAVCRSPYNLAHAALNVTLARARSVSAFVARAPRRGGGGGAVRDCVQTVGDAADQLRRSMAEVRVVGRRGSRGFAWHMSNLRTWVSAALTDETTCLDGVSAAGLDRQLRAAIRAKIVELAQVTSNALALVNLLGATP